MKAASVPARPACCLGSRPRPSTRRWPPTTSAPNTSAQARSGRRRASRERGRWASTPCARSARASLHLWLQSGASTRPTPRSVWKRGLSVSPWFARPPASQLSGRPSSVRLSELGELGLLAELERRGLAEQIGDVAAELEPGLVVTQDSLVEGVHFRLEWLSWRELGFRAAAVNISDLAASGARPEALIVSLGLPGETELDDVLELYAGIAETGVPVRGGDTTEAASVFATVV